MSISNLTRLSALLLAIAASAFAQPGASPVPATSKIDWATYAHDLTRGAYNPSETALSPTTVSKLKQHWATRLDGGAITGQPIVATNIATTGGTRDLVIVGTEKGAITALDAATGRAVWTRATGFTHPGCMDLPRGQFGISSTAVYDKASSRVYSMGGDGKLYALNIADGTTVAGWPVTILPNASTEHVYGALTLYGGAVYVTNASMCDANTYHGRVTRVSTGARPAITTTFYPDGTTTTTGGKVVTFGGGGGGVWGAGGLSVDTKTRKLYIAVGNNFGSANEFDFYGDHVVTLSPALKVLDSNYPKLPDPNTDEDFGSTPVLFQGAAGCPQSLAAINKDGLWFTYDRSALAKGPTASEPNNSYVGDVAFDAGTKLLFVTNLDRVEGWQQTTTCALAKVWSVPTSSGPGGQLGQSISPPTTANGVVYYGNGEGQVLQAFNAATGATLYTHKLGGSIFAAPTVVNGTVYVSAWDGRVYAFGL